MSGGWPQPDVPEAVAPAALESAAYDVPCRHGEGNDRGNAQARRSRLSVHAEVGIAGLRRFAGAREDRDALEPYDAFE